MTSLQIDIFISVARHLNFTKAAEELYIAQPTLSRQLKLLEEEWGFDLFVRNRKEVRLTPAGAIMLGKAKEAKRIIDEGLLEQQHKTVNMNGILRIGILESMNIDFKMLKGVAEFSTAYPNIELITRYRSFGELNLELMNGNLDAIFTYDIQFPALKDCLYNCLYKIPCGVILSKSHPLASKPDLSISDLDGETLILPREKGSVDLYAQTELLFRPYGVEHLNILYVPNVDSILPNVIAGNGIGILGGNIRSVHNQDQIRYLLFDESVAPLSVIVAWKKEDLNPLVALFAMSFFS